jgi:hypothetical protein
MKSWLPKRLSIGFVFILWLLSGCSSNPNPSPVQNTLDGLWLENTARSSHCDNAASYDSKLKLDLKVQNKQVTGSITMMLLESGTELKGSFSGTQNEKRLTGVITFSNQRNWDADLSLTTHTLEGSLTDQTEELCATSGSDYWKTQVAFLREVTEPVSVDNKEPNNSATQAAPIQLEESFNLSLSSNDIDWFKFSLAKPAEIQFDVTLLTAMGLRASILNEDQEVQNNLESSSSSLTTQANSWQIKTQLPAGNYFLVITGFDDETLSGKHQDNGRYTLSFISKNDLPDDASEPNDTSTQASPITLDFSKEHYLGIGDQDWFSFTLSKSQLLQFSLQAGPNFIATLYSQDLQELFSTYNFTAQPFSRLLPSGKYYLKLTREISQGGYYTLNIKAQTVIDAALEPNNTFDTATSITLDYEGSSYLDSGDQDWYTFTLNETRLVTFNFNNLYGFSFQLFDVSNSDLGLYYNGSSLTQALLVGTYYLRLSDGYNLTIPIKITSTPLPDKTNEPNNSLNTATPITLDFKGSSYLYKDDDDWYSFRLNQQQLVTFDFGIYPSIEIRLFDEQSNNLGLYYSSEPVVKNLGSGVYYLQLSNPYHQNLPVIPMNITSVAAPDIDLEPNNSFNKATAITLPFSHQVYTSSEDTDWYTFTLTRDTLVTYHLVNQKTYMGEVQLNLVDNIGQTITYVSTAPSDSNKPVANFLKAGTYYLRILGDYGIQYDLHIKTEALTDIQFEPNNSITQPYNIPVGFNQSDLVVFSSSLLKLDDIDVFRLELSETIQLDILVTKQTGGFYLNASVLDANGNQFHYLNPDEPTDRIFPPGAYFFVISSSGSDSSAMKYSLKVTEK